MKKIITLSLMLVTLAFSATFASAQTYQQQQNRYEQNRRNWRNNRGVRVVTQTRIVRQGWRTFRETIQIKYLPNGRTQTTVISRTRIR